MATHPVRFEFKCDKGTLNFTHNIPSSLIGTNPGASQQGRDYFAATIKPIIDLHYLAVVIASNTVCCICPSPKTLVIFTPMSGLHNASDPLVFIVCEPACNKPACETKIRQNVQATIADVAAKKSLLGVGPEKNREIMPCRLCMSMVINLKCSHCGIAFYCGEEHRKLDWPFHKEVCKANGRSDEA